MLTLKSNVPSSFVINYDVTTNDSKTEGQITTAKFFLAISPGEADNKYFLKTQGSGLTYNSGTGEWTVQVDQGDLDNVSGDQIFRGILAIQYTGETDYREPDLYEGTELLQIQVDPHFSD